MVFVPAELCGIICVYVNQLYSQVNLQSMVFHCKCQHKVASLKKTLGCLHFVSCFDRNYDPKSLHYLRTKTVEKSIFFGWILHVMQLNISVIILIINNLALFHEDKYMVKHKCLFIMTSSNNNWYWLYINIIIYLFLYFGCTLNSFPPIWWLGEHCIIESIDHLFTNIEGRGGINVDSVPSLDRQ